MLLVSGSGVKGKGEEGLNVCLGSRPSRYRIMQKSSTSLGPCNPKPKANMHTLLVLHPLRVVMAKEENYESATPGLPCTDFLTCPAISTYSRFASNFNGNWLIFICT